MSTWNNWENCFTVSFERTTWCWFYCSNFEIRSWFDQITAYPQFDHPIDSYHTVHVENTHYLVLQNVPKENQLFVKKRRNVTDTICESPWNPRSFVLWELAWRFIWRVYRYKKALWLMTVFNLTHVRYSVFCSSRMPREIVDQRICVRIRATHTLVMFTFDLLQYFLGDGKSWDIYLFSFSSRLIFTQCLLTCAYHCNTEMIFYRVQNISSQ